MLSNLVGALIKIISLIWNAPTWLVLLVLFLFAVVYFIWKLFSFDGDMGNSDGTGHRVESSYAHTDEAFPVKFDKVEHPFVFYDSQGNRCGRGSCFYDSKGDRRSWGDGFYDGKGYYRNWGDSYYDARGYFRSWGECFYDAQDNLVYPD